MNEIIHRNKLLTGDLARVMCQLISHAKKSIYLSCYYIQNPNLCRLRKISDIFSALEKAAKRGIDVKVLLNHQPLTSPKYIQNLPAAIWFLRRRVPCRYLDRGTTLHAKLLIVDSLYIIAGSHNLSPTSLEKNVEASFLISDPNTASAAATWFSRYWEKSLDFPPHL